ncbi:DUF3327 domain-containing protein [Micromonospora sp. WMMD1076]|nr:enterochelin esterase domain-containing protein [Micromonospora sp. WMMD1076]WFF04500.1 DUF3327 domain-containing protein [Micromonospora sp. WMMD1076]
MRRMPGTDLWHLTHRVRHDWQGSYHLAPDEGTETVPDPGPAHWRSFAANLVADPYNPRTPPRSRPPHKSVAAAAQAGPRWRQPRPDVPAGRTDVATIATGRGPRRAWRYLPPEHRAEDGPYPDEVDAEWFARRVALADRRPVRWHVEVGLDEWVNVQPNRHLRDVLTARGYPLTYAEFAGGHDRLCRHDRLGDALTGLLR